MYTHTNVCKGNPRKINLTKPWMPFVSTHHHHPSTSALKPLSTHLEVFKMTLQGAGTRSCGWEGAMHAPQLSGPYLLCG